MRRRVNLLSAIERQGRKVWIPLGLALLGCVGYLDWLTGYELSFSLFYLLPIALTTWMGGRGMAVASSLVSALAWFTAEVTAGRVYSHPLFYGWNTLIRLGFFLVTGLLLAGLRERLELEKKLARTDSLTGAVNARLFYELLEIEVARAARYGHTLVLAYLDLDNFKAVNDAFGHATGDRVLRRVADTLRANLRKPDWVARLGGDEFALLLPGTDREAAERVVEKIRGKIAEAMQEAGWPVTLSVEALLVEGVSHPSQELVRMADDLMYEVKGEGKDAVKFAVAGAAG